MDLLIKNATVITGDGATVLENGVILVEKGRIADVLQGADKIPHDISVGTTIDATGQVVFPGVINHHTHACTAGPLYPSGAPPLATDKVIKNLDRHLREGTTTLMNVCGLGTVEETERLRRIHPMNLKTGTAHTPSSIKAAEATDGAGLTPAHKALTVEKMLADGAACIGEIGAGMTLGGGGQDYLYIPRAVKSETGRDIDAPVAHRLKVAILGRYLDAKSFSEANTKAVLDEAGLSGLLTVERARELVTQSVMPSVDLALKGFEEAVQLSADTGVPVVLHNSAPCAQKLVDLARQYRGTRAKIVCGHSNHSMFTPDEAVQFARQLRELGAVIDISTLDAIQTWWRNKPDPIDALAAAGLIDTISTDYAGGHWDSITAAVQRLWRLKLLPLPKAIALTTGNVARLFPLLAPERGFIERGKVADLIISDDKNVARVETVIVGGKAVIDNGRTRY